MTVVRRRARRPAPRLLPAVLVLLAALPVAAATSPAAAAAAVPLVAPVTLPATIEAMPAYQPQTFCRPVATAGVKALAALLTTAYPDTSVASEARSCDSESGTSEHKDGRALDWAASYKNAQQVAEVHAVFRWLFAPDADGNAHAMLRRLGIMYIIWNGRIWGSWSQQWEPYSCSGVTGCHRDHVHFSLDWAGAQKKTSFWTGRVAASVAPPTYVYASNAFAQSLSVPAGAPDTVTPFSVRGGDRYRVTVTGTYAVGGGHLGDAACSDAGGAWTRDGSGLAVGAHRWWRPTGTATGGCATSTHSYTRVLTFSRTGPVTLRLRAPAGSSAHGSLHLAVAHLPSTS